MQAAVRHCCAQPKLHRIYTNGACRYANVYGMRRYAGRTLENLGSEGRCDSTPADSIRAPGEETGPIQTPNRSRHRRARASGRRDRRDPQARPGIGLHHKGGAAADPMVGAGELEGARAVDNRSRVAPAPRNQPRSPTQHLTGQTQRSGKEDPDGQSSRHHAGPGARVCDRLHSDSVRPALTAPRDPNYRRRCEAGIAALRFGHKDAMLRSECSRARDSNSCVSWLGTARLNKNP